MDSKPSNWEAMIRELIADAATGASIRQTVRRWQPILAALPSEPPSDPERLARAICASRHPEVADDADLFVDDECRALARRVAARLNDTAPDSTK